MADEQDFNKYTVVRLRAKLKKRGLITSGLKKDLVARMERASNGTLKDADREGGGTTTAPTKKATTKRKRAPAKKQEESESEDDEEEEDSEASESSSEDEPPAKKKRTAASGAGTHRVDKMCSLSNASVVQDYDCTLNQTDISANSNKFYMIQLIKSGPGYYLFTKWGRVGEDGKSQTKRQADEDAGIAAFEKQFKAKTANDWINRANFKTKAKKYTLLEMDYGNEEEEEEEEEDEDEEEEDSEENTKGKGKARAAPARTQIESKLPKPTQDLIRLIFDLNMFQKTMEDFNIDLKKMPLGKLSKTQIAKGHKVLEKIESVLRTGARGDLSRLTSKFYTVIPHAYGRRPAPPFTDLESVQKRKDMLNVISDIAVAQDLTADKSTDAGPRQHIFDVNYDLLKADLEPLETNGNEYKIIERYLNATQGKYGGLEILDVFRVRRHGEEERFDQHKDITNRKLLWHGTNVAVVVAILSSGLRIMPHSGGRVGRGIYFASENAKSAGYVGRSSDGTGIMFLSEVALGQEHGITQDDSTLRAAPPGFDSVVARGTTEPDPAFDTKLTIDGLEVTVPQGEPKRMREYANSSFSHSEYLIYKESQNRIRYLLKLKFPY
eukprot:TRINITY_DN6446_c0_g1_i1.p1 TRINITY_DN6446_c0_g1~~TRINITY_DN6446_c0_g1_i1.p1  ORF type:complete len:619 (+),score=162.67 TRINITY_DN6446_c0_g1_i1:33-1859(+)